MFHLFQFRKNKSAQLFQKRRLTLEVLEARPLLAVMAGATTMPLETGTAFMVTTLEDVVDASDNVLSLREALASAVAGDTITFGVSGTILLSDSLGVLTVAPGVTMDGAGQTVTLDGNDKVGILNIAGENAASVTIIKNLTLTGGYAAEGGAINYVNWDPNASITIDHCVFSGNTGTSVGGSVRIFNAVTHISDCEFTNFSGETSYAWSGAGLALNNYGKETIIENTTFSNLTSSYFGGGIYVNGDSTNVLVRNCEFSNNSNYRGAAIFFNNYNTANAAITVQSCVFTKNSASAGKNGEVGNGGVVYLASVTGTANFVDCVFTENTGLNSGGAINSSGMAINIYGGSFADNVCVNASAESGGGAISTNNTLNINQENEGVAHEYQMTLFSGNRVEGDTSVGGGAICFIGTTANIANAQFVGNRSTSKDNTAGGGAVYQIKGIMNFSNCLFTDNASEAGGGGYYLHAKEGGGTSSFDYCTFANNSSVNESGNAIFAESSVTIADSIIATNGTNDVYLQVIGTVNVSYSMVGTHAGAEETNTWTEGEGVVQYTEGMTLFNDMAGGDYTLAAESVAIDVNGNRGGFEDLAGKNGCVNLLSDMGCYEYQGSEITPLATPLFEVGNVASYGANRHSAVWGAVTNGVEYELAYSANGATDWTTVKTTELSTVVTNLTYGAQMSYKVRAIGDGVTYSDSEWSQTLLLNVCPMDLDGDGRIGPADRTLLASAWLARPSSSNWDVRADIDGNNTVASGDRTFLTSNYLKAVTATDLSYPPALAEAVFAEGVEVDDVDDFAVPTLDVDFNFLG